MTVLADKLPRRPRLGVRFAKAEEPARAAAPGLERGPHAPTSTGAPALGPSRTTVPLDRLEVSPLNVRKTDVDREIAALAADIDAHGLLQNLVVVAPRAPSERYEVIAGARRLQALAKLVRDGRLAADWPVPVLVEPRDEAREISLAENVTRIAMNPADAFEAYRQILADHEDEPGAVDRLARRQGVSRRHVEQMLRLGDLAPEILAALRAERIGIEAARAYAGVPDRALQLHAFNVEERRTVGPAHAPRNIRDQLAARTYPAGGAKAVFVGLDAYAAAGGRTARDLFLGAEEDRLLDPSILDALCQAKAEREAAACAARDGFAGGLVAGGVGIVAPSWPEAPDGLTERVVEPAHARLAPERRAAAIAVYVLAGDGRGLSCLGAYARPLVSEAARRSDEAFARAVDQVEVQRDERHGEVRRLRALQLAAARLAVEQKLGDALAGRSHWPDAAYTAPISATPDRDDGFLVTVQIRVTRAELEAALPEAEKQLAGEAA